MTLRCCVDDCRSQPAPRRTGSSFNQRNLVLSVATKSPSRQPQTQCARSLMITVSEPRDRKGGSLLLLDRQGLWHSQVRSRSDSVRKSRFRVLHVPAERPPTPARESLPRGIKTGLSISGARRAAQAPAPATPERVHAERAPHTEPPYRRGGPAPRAQPAAQSASEPTAVCGGSAGLDVEKARPDCVQRRAPPAAASHAGPPGRSCPDPGRRPAPARPTRPGHGRTARRGGIRGPGRDRGRCRPTPPSAASQPLLLPAMRPRSRPVRTGQAQRGRPPRARGPRRGR